MDTTKTVETPYNNAVAIINRTNELLNENNILDSTGNQIAQLEQNVANPAWLFALACGSLHTSWQEQLAKAYACLDPQNCEDDQVLVLASLAGLSRGNGTPSHVTVTILNSDSSSSVTVPSGTTFTETYTNNTWVLNQDVTIDASGEEYATLYTTVDGEFSLPSGTTLTYDGDLTIVCETVAQSAGGSDIETIASLRNRISQGTESNDVVSQCKTAIELLSGIDSCTIWVNQSSSNTMTVGTKTIPIREAYLSIKGYDYSGKVAETYFNYMNIPATVGDESETCLIGQQELVCHFDYAQEVEVQIYITMLASDMAVGAAAAIIEAITAYSGTLDCGQNLTAQQVSEWIQNLGYGTVVGCNVGSSTGLISDIDADEYCVFNEDTITVTSV